MDLSLKYSNVVVKEKPFENDNMPFPKQKDSLLKKSVCQEQFLMEFEIAEDLGNSMGKLLSREVDQKLIPCDETLRNDSHSHGDDKSSSNVVVKEEPFENDNIPFPKQEDGSFKISVCQEQFDKEIKIEKHSGNSMGELLSREVDQKLIPCDETLRNDIHSHGADKSSNVVVKEEPFENDNMPYSKQEDCSLKKSVCQEQFHMEFKIEEDSCNSTGELFSPEVDQKSFPYDETLRSDIHSHGADKSFSTKKYETRIAQRQDLKKHLRKSIPNKPYACAICSKSFFYKETLDSHLKTHANDRKECPTKKPRNICVQKEKRKKTSEPVTCDICQLTLLNIYNLKQHLLIHKNQRPYACVFCPKKFNRKGMLKNHLLIHTGERPHVCDICHKSFTMRSYLKTHLLTHTGERPHVCDICHKSFTMRSHLKTHLLTHTGERPHVCDICHKSFTMRCYLKTHLLTHTGEKPYACDICGSTFTQKSGVIAHLSNKHSMRINFEKSSIDL